MQISSAGTHLSSSLLQTRRVSQRGCLDSLTESQELVVPSVHTDSKTRTVEFPMLNRIDVNKISKEFDLIVIGGGINGCGIARDASERGLKVLLLEKEDFGAGCTSASSRLIHGGLRYLEHFEFDLVRESLCEREILLNNANHLVRPLELCIPIYSGDKRGYWTIKAGMLLYDLLSFDKSLPRHKMLSASGFSQYEPSVRQDNLLGGAVYYDTQIAYAERLCVENAIMAKQESAVVLNHTEVVGVKTDSRKISSVDFVDRLTGKQYSARGKYIVNVSGPWVDVLCGLVRSDLKKQIGGTKGSHIVIKKFDNGPRHALYVSAKSDGRPFFIIPWQDYYLIGTTDIPYSGDLDHVRMDETERQYLINEANRVLQSHRITASDVLFSCSGVRPLPCVDGKDPAEITRRHILFDHEKEVPFAALEIITSFSTEELAGRIYGNVEAIKEHPILYSMPSTGVDLLLQRFPVFPSTAQVFNLFARVK